MDVTLSPRTQKLLEDQMKHGGYSTAEDVIRVALETLDLQAHEPLDEATLAALEEGEAQIDRGESRPWEEVRAELRAKYLRK